MIRQIGNTLMVKYSQIFNIMARMNDVKHWISSLKDLNRVRCESDLPTFFFLYKTRRRGSCVQLTLAVTHDVLFEINLRKASMNL